MFCFRQNSLVVHLVGASVLLATISLAQQARPGETFNPEPPIEASILWPQGGTTFSDGPDMGIPLIWRATDYDGVTYTSNDGTKSFSNRLRTLPANLYGTWSIVGGGGQIYTPPSGPPNHASYIPPALPENEPSRNVTLELTVVDLVTGTKHDPVDPKPQVTFTIARKKPCIRQITISAIHLDGQPVIATGLSSGFSASDKIKLCFQANLHYAGDWAVQQGGITWTTPWPGGVQDGATYTTPIIPENEAHRRFSVSVSVTWEKQEMTPPPPRWITHTDVKSNSFPLCWGRGGHDEWYNTDRGRILDEVENPPNWFDNCPNHWGAGTVIARMTEQYNYNNNNYYIVHYIPTFTDNPGMHSTFDPWGAYAPTVQEKYQEKYRGRIIIAGDHLVDDEAFGITPYGVVAGGIDHTAGTVAHEFMHRDHWLANKNWGGFDEAAIGGPTGWKPMDTDFNYDYKPNQNGHCDFIKDGWEQDEGNMNTYHCHYQAQWSVEKWWTGNDQIGSGPNVDQEMIAQLWGEWNGHLVSNLDGKDWATNGRQDYP